MHRSTQQRWIAEAEARRVRDFAVTERAIAEAPASPAAPGRFLWLEWLRGLLPGLSPAAPRSAPPLGSAPAAERHPAAPVVATVLVTDIVESARRAAAIRDRRWRVLLDCHDAEVRWAVARFHGRVVKNLGEGFLATFAGPASAVRCAAAIVAATTPLGITVRSGIHIGEVDMTPDDISGIAVDIAARLASAAPPGEPLVSGTVRDLAAGSGIVFRELGIRAMRGLPEELRLYTAISADEA